MRHIRALFRAIAWVAAPISNAILVTLLTILAVGLLALVFCICAGLITAFEAAADGTEPTGFSPLAMVISGLITFALAVVMFTPSGISHTVTRGFGLSPKRKGR